VRPRQVLGLDVLDLTHRHVHAVQLGGGRVQASLLVQGLQLPALPAVEFGDDHRDEVEVAAPGLEIAGGQGPSGIEAQHPSDRLNRTCEGHHDGCLLQSHVHHARVLRRRGQ